MNKLSRTKRYQDLRDSLDEETTLNQSKTMIREDADFSHANQPLHPHLEESVRPNVEFQSSPVMDELLGEVKQYNIANGNRIENDTQINILRQLDAAPSAPRKKAHIVEMEETPEYIGNTVKLPKSLNQDLDVASFMSQSSFDEDIKPVREEEKVVLKPTNIQVDDVVEEDNLALLGDTQPVFDEDDDEEIVEKKPRKNKKLKKAKKQKEKKQKFVEETEELPSAKMRMMSEDYEEVTESKKGGRIINFVIFILILLLIATIGVAVFILKDSGVL